MLSAHRKLLIGQILLIAAVAGPMLEHSALAGSCDKAVLQRSAPSGTTVTSASPQSVPAPYQATTYCAVSGEIETSGNGQNNQVRFALGMPAEWNQNFLFIGNEGFGGLIEAVKSGEFAVEISRGYATAATDEGHQSALKATGALDGSFGMTAGQPNVAARDDYAWRAVHVSAVAAEALTEAYYDSAMFAFLMAARRAGARA